MAATSLIVHCPEWFFRGSVARRLFLASTEYKNLQKIHSSFFLAARSAISNFCQLWRSVAPVYVECPGWKLACQQNSPRPIRLHSIILGSPHTLPLEGAKVANFGFCTLQVPLKGSRRLTPRQEMFLGMCLRCTNKFDDDCARNNATVNFRMYPIFAFLEVSDGHPSEPKNFFFDFPVFTKGKQHTWVWSESATTCDPIGWNLLEWPK